jgi:hypothetical protein
MEINIFEFAAKHALRFPFRGNITTEDLYSLRLEDLDKIYKELNRTLKAQEEESLLSTKTDTSTLLDVQIALVKHIVADKQHQRKLAEEAFDRREKKQKLLALIAEKDEDTLRNMSKEDLQKALADLEKQ